MSLNKEAFHQITSTLKSRQVTMVAVSKNKPPADIKAFYDLGQRDFGENYVQELVGKAANLPRDIRWHFIGHLQTNKVKYIAPFVQLIQSVDSLKLLKEIEKQAKKSNRVIDCLLQVHIAQEETKFGFDGNGLDECVRTSLENTRIRGLMGMASLVDEPAKIRDEYRYLKSLFDRYALLQKPGFEMKILSMGMSSDYTIAVDEGSNMVRIGSLIFGDR